MFAVWGCDEALGAEVGCPTGCVHVPELRTVLRIPPISVKNGLWHAVREKVCVAGVWAAVTRSASKSDEVREQPVVCVARVIQAQQFRFPLA